MKKALLVLAAAVLALATPALAEVDGCSLPFTNGKLDVVVHVDGCTVVIKASTDLPNACAELVQVDIFNSVSSSQVGLVVVGDPGGCLVTVEPDGSGNGVAKAACGATGRTKINLTLSSCSPA